MAIEQAAPPTHAQDAGCGGPKTPCYVANTYFSPLFTKPGPP
jgi:hypothetical protein